MREGAAFVAKTGIVPAAYAGAINRWLASDDPNLSGLAALHLSETLAREPKAAPFVVGDNQTVFAATAAAYQQAGFKPATAVTKARTNVLEGNAEAKRFRRDAYRLDRNSQSTPTGSQRNSSAA